MFLNCDTVSVNIVIILYDINSSYMPHLHATVQVTLAHNKRHTLAHAHIYTEHTHTLMASALQLYSTKSEASTQSHVT